MSRNLRFALRSLRRKPSFAGAVVVVLALGIGAGTAVFSVTEGILLRPLPYRDSARLVALLTRSPDYSNRFPLFRPSILTRS